MSNKRPTEHSASTTGIASLEARIRALEARQINTVADHGTLSSWLAFPRSLIIGNREGAAQVATELQKLRQQLTQESQVLKSRPPMATPTNADQTISEKITDLASVLGERRKDLKNAKWMRLAEVLAIVLTMVLIFVQTCYLRRQTKSTQDQLELQRASTINQRRTELLAMVFDCPNPWPLRRPCSHRNHPVLRLEAVRELLSQGKEIERPVDLSGADFDGLDFAQAGALSPFSFANATLKQTIFSNTKLSGVDFEKADLSQAIFHDAELVGVHLDGVDLSSASFSDSPDFTGASLAKSTFRNQASSLRYGNVATPYDKRFRGARFVSADLTGAIMMNLDLSGADFEGADMKGTDLSNSSLIDVKNLSKTQLDQALGNSSTQLADGMTQPNHWQDLSTHP